MKSFYALLMAATLLTPPVLLAAHPAFAAEQPAKTAPAAPAATAEQSYTVAVLPFTAKQGSDLEEMSQQIPELMNAFMSATPSLMMVERAEVDKALSEVELGKSGTVDPATAAKVGHLVGAQVLVTGMIIPVQRDYVIVAKIIGVETGRTFGDTVDMPMRGNIKDAAIELANKVSAKIADNGKTMIAVEKKEDLLAELRPLMEGAKNLPTVSVAIDAMNMNKTDTDTAAQTEIAWLLQKLGFTVIDELASNKKADIEVTGTASSEFAMRKGNLVSAKARVEIKAIKHADGKVVLVDREPTVAVDLSPDSAGHAAETKAASALAGRLVKAIMEK